MGDRYGIIALATRFSHLNRWLVIPTSTSARPAGYRPEVEVIGQPTLCLCDALTSLDPEQRLGAQVDFLPLASMQQIDRVLARLLDLAWPPAPGQNR